MSHLHPEYLCHAVERPVEEAVLAAGTASNGAGGMLVGGAPAETPLQADHEQLCLGVCPCCQPVAFQCQSCLCHTFLSIVEITFLGTIMPQRYCNCLMLLQCRAAYKCVKLILACCFMQTSTCSGFTATG